MTETVSFPIEAPAKMWLLSQKFSSQLFNLWHCLIILFLAVQGANALVQIDKRTCGANRKKVNKALDEAVAMAEFAHQRQVGLRDGSLSPPDARVTMNTFLVYFTKFSTPGIAVSPGLCGYNEKKTGNRLIGESSPSNR